MAIVRLNGRLATVQVYDASIVQVCDAKDASVVVVDREWPYHVIEKLASGEAYAGLVGLADAMAAVARAGAKDAEGVWVVMERPDYELYGLYAPCLDQPA